jgi:hypothetical protein
MAKKQVARGDASSTDPKRLRQRLRKAEAKLAKSEAKRDKAQARVEAFAIIADEIRAQLAESEKASAEAEVAAAKRTDTDTDTRHPTATTSRRAASKRATQAKRSTKPPTT